MSDEPIDPACWKQAMMISSLINQQRDGGYPIEDVTRYLMATQASNIQQIARKSSIELRRATLALNWKKKDTDFGLPMSKMEDIILECATVVTNKT